MAQGMTDDIITEGVSIGNMSSEEVDAFLSQIVANDDRSSKTSKSAKKDPDTAKPSSPDAPKISKSNAGPPQPDPKASAADVENTLEQVDAQLADLEALLAAATGSEEVDAPACDVSGPQPPQAYTSVSKDGQSPQAEVEPDAGVTKEETSVQEPFDNSPDARESVTAEAEQTAGVVPVAEQTPSEEQLQGQPIESAAMDDTPFAEQPPAIEEPILKDSPTVAADDPQVRRQKRLLSLPAALVGITGKLLVHVLILLDLPFARLGRGIKNAVGYAAIATFLVAVGTWVASAYLRNGL